MDAETMILLFIMMAVAFIMFGIGLSQIKSKRPVGFYSGEKAPDEKELSDVHAWNVKHGTMWVIYGAIIVITSIIGVLMIDSVWCTVPLIGGVCLPLPVMIWYHHKLIIQYKR